MTDAVHAEDDAIVQQIRHLGCQSHVGMTNGQTPVAPSVAPCQQVFTKDG